MSNFGISQVKFDMHLLYWVVKILARKPGNWIRADDNYIYLMWGLTNKVGDNQVKFIIGIMIHCRDNPKRPLFHSSFIQMILELNVIVCKEKELIESPKILDFGNVLKMRYYRDSNEDYYYLEESGRKIYDDKIVEPVKEVVGDVGPSDIGATSFAYIDVKTLLNEIIQILMDDNYIREDRIMAQIDMLVCDNEDKRSMMRTKLRVEVKEHFQSVEGRVTAQIEALKASID